MPPKVAPGASARCRNGLVLVALQDNVAEQFRAHSGVNPDDPSRISRGKLADQFPDSGGDYSAQVRLGLIGYEHNFIAAPCFANSHEDSPFDFRRDRACE